MNDFAKVKWQRRAALLITSLLTTNSFAFDSKYFQLDLKLEINSVPYEVKYNWHCYKTVEGPNFGPGNILQIVWKQSPPLYRVLKKIDDDAVFFFQPIPYCGKEYVLPVDESENFFPPVTIVKSVKDPAMMEVFNPNKTQGVDFRVTFQSGIIKQLDKSAPDYVATDEEKRLKQALEDNSHGYWSVSARILPAVLWEQSEALKHYFRNANGILIAPTPSQLRSDIVGMDGRNNFFPVDQAGVFPPRGLDINLYTVPLIKVGTVWQLSTAYNASFGMLFFAPSSTENDGKARRFDIGNPPPATVNYDGTLIKVLGSQQIYDSKRQLLIQFVNNYQPLPWIGLRE